MTRDQVPFSGDKSRGRGLSGGGRMGDDGDPLCPPLCPRKSCLQALGSNRIRKSLMPNRVKGAFTSTDNYLRTHVELLRADFTLALARQLQEFRASRNNMQSNSCDGDRVFKIRIEQKRDDDDDLRGHCRRVHFQDSDRVKSIKWTDDKRLLYGSLVLVSTDGFRSFEMALVRERPPKFQLEGLTAVGMKGYFKTHPLVARWGVMMEANAFYLAYFHVMERLRMVKRVPFERELVYCDSVENTMPTYLKTVFMEPSSVTRLVRLFLDSTGSELSPSQLEAMYHVLSHRVALVQGPPGTGKTHLAVQIAAFLLYVHETLRPKKVSRLKSVVQEQKPPPILVVTTTRHAVVEFLKRCTSFTEKILHARSTKFEEDEREKEEEEVMTALQEEYYSCENHNRLKVMQKADIIAMTTTRATLTRSLIKALNIQVVIVEEAAEALEAFVVASIPLSAQHLILVGDHKQLRPSTAHHLLSSKFLLDVSLFQRLVENGFDCSVLSEQRRMRPEISGLLKHIYPSLRDHPSTLGRPDISGVGKNVFFIAHNESEETKIRGCTSFANRYEAKFVVALMEYLLGQGYAAESISILTTYKKQEQIIRSMMGKDCKVRLSSVDGFQGEENQIIILSLVRGNNEGSVGFMKLENRACVALSRARSGLYIIGNMRTLLASGAPVWSRVHDELQGLQAMGPALELQCHHARKIMVKSAEEIRQARTGCVLCKLEASAAEAAQRSCLASARYWNFCKNIGDLALPGTEYGRELLVLSRESERANTAAKKVCSKLHWVNGLLREGAIDLEVDTVETVDLVCSLKDLSL